MKLERGNKHIRGTVVGGLNDFTMIRTCVITVSVGWVVLFGMGKLEFKLGRNKYGPL